ncbi:MAG TPA: DUF4330 domain-containing protein [Firmicutes bacterium]|nr:DUF4330 domain-containing protein [Bacillota bacterium]
MLDEKGRLFGLVNIIDLAVVLVFGLVLAFGAYKFLYVNPSYQPEPKTVRVELVVEGVRQPTVDAIALGDRVYEKNSNGYFGTITDIKVVPAKEVVPTADGKLVEAEVPGRYDIYLTLESPAEVSEEYIQITGQQVRIGLTPTIRTRTYQVETVVFGLEVLD